VSLPRRPAHQQRDLITDPALELPHHAVRIGERAALRGFPDHQRAVSGQNSTDGMAGERLPSGTT
jgi:hypothetical protein